MVVGRCSSSGRRVGGHVRDVRERGRGDLRAAAGSRHHQTRRVDGGHHGALLQGTDLAAVPASPSHCSQSPYPPTHQVILPTRPPTKLSYPPTHQVILPTRPPTKLSYPPTHQVILPTRPPTHQRLESIRSLLKSVSASTQVDSSAYQLLSSTPQLLWSTSRVSVMAALERAR